MGGKLHFYQLSEQNPAIVELSTCGAPLSNKDVSSDLESMDVGNEDVGEHQRTKHVTSMHFSI